MRSLKRLGWFFKLTLANLSLEKRHSRIIWQTFQTHTPIQFKHTTNLTKYIILTQLFFVQISNQVYGVELCLQALGDAACINGLYFALTTVICFRGADMVLSGCNSTMQWDYRSGTAGKRKDGFNQRGRKQLWLRTRCLWVDKHSRVFIWLIIYRMIA